MKTIALLLILSILPSFGLGEIRFMRKNAGGTYILVDSPAPTAGNPYFLAINPVTNSPTIMPMGWEFAADSLTNSINLSSAFWDQLDTDYMTRPEAETAIADMQADIASISLTPGPTGATGAAGATGPKGDKGDTGTAGTNGTNGLPGAKGDTGDTGPTGSTGLTGSTGPQGIQGIQGVKGDKGDAGDQGPQGIQGVTGNTGAAGTNATTTSVATTSVNGLLSASDKAKLDGLNTKRRETYSGTTNGSGVYTVTFGTAFSVAPNIQVSLNGGTDTQTWRVTSITTTGFSVTVRNRVDVIGLLPTYSNVATAALDVLITEK